MKCHYDIIVLWYHSFMISWFGEFGYHSWWFWISYNDFIYMKSLYDFIISLNHIWYHSYETRSSVVWFHDDDIIIWCQSYDIIYWFHHHEIIIWNHTWTHVLKSLLWNHMLMKSYSDFMGLNSWLWFHVWFHAMK